MTVLPRSASKAAKPVQSAGVNIAWQDRLRHVWLRRALVNLVLLLIVGVFGAPFLWLAAAAFDRSADASVFWPRDPTFVNFRALFDNPEIGDALRTSLIVALASTGFAAITASLAGYGLSRMSFRRKTWISYAILLLYTIPLPVTLVAIYDLAFRLRLQDTYRGLILTHTAVSLPFLVWLMKGFFDALPWDTEEAALTDGASPLRAWLDVLLPQTLAGLAVVAGFAFAYAWAEVLMAIAVLPYFGKQTLPMTFFRLADDGSDTQQIAALGVLYILPVLLVFLLLRRLMIRGLVEGTHGL